MRLKIVVMMMVVVVMDTHTQSAGEDFVKGIKRNCQPTIGAALSNAQIYDDYNGDVVSVCVCVKQSR